jgi:8-oxo-dGTP pyrophosphatase MutT (NUDIX family)
MSHPTILAAGRERFITAVRDRLAGLERQPIVETFWNPARSAEPRPAAVLIPLYQHDGEWHVLLTERTHTVAEHQGQVAFPGGKTDPTDKDRIETALRETAEEIGLPPERVEVLGTMPEFLTSTGYHVTPVAGVIPWPCDLNLSAAELARVFGVPLRWVADPAHLTIEMWEHPGKGPGTPVYFFRYGEHTIWGATARMLHAFVEILLSIPG